MSLKCHKAFLCLDKTIRKLGLPYILKIFEKCEFMATFTAEYFYFHSFN